LSHTDRQTPPMRIQNALPATARPTKPSRHHRPSTRSPQKAPQTHELFHRRSPQTLSKRRGKPSKEQTSSRVGRGCRRNRTRSASRRLLHAHEDGRRSAADAWLFPVSSEPGGSSAAAPTSAPAGSLTAILPALRPSEPGEVQSLDATRRGFGLCFAAGAGTAAG
jgi:hypothetical protein